MYQQRGCKRQVFKKRYHYGRPKNKKIHHNEKLCGKKKKKGLVKWCITVNAAGKIIIQNKVLQMQILFRTVINQLPQNEAGEEIKFIPSTETKNGSKN